jgi:hypothetical protein
MAQAVFTRCLSGVAVASALFAGPALACSPGIFTPSAVPVAGPNCALRIDLNEVDSVHLGEATATPAGLILQPLSDGNGCYARFNLLVHDCSAGQVLVIGTEHFNLMADAGNAPTGLERIRDAALASDGPRDLPGFAALSEAGGYGTPLTLHTSQSLRFGTQTLPVACACREAAQRG